MEYGAVKNLRSAEVVSLWKSIDSDEHKIRDEAHVVHSHAHVLPSINRRRYFSRREKNDVMILMLDPNDVNTRG